VFPEAFCRRKYLRQIFDNIHLELVHIALMLFGFYKYQQLVGLALLEFQTHHQ